MSLLPPFQYRKLGDFTYHLLSDPQEIKSHLTKWIVKEWESDHNLAPDEQWTDEWMRVFPGMEFQLATMPLADICPHPDLWSLQQFQRELKERTDDRVDAVLRGVSIEPLLVNRQGLQLMDGYTRYVVLKRYEQNDVFAYIGHA